MSFQIRRMEEGDAEALARAFAPYGKTRAQFERYLDEQGRGQRVTLLATEGGRVVGYGNLLWRSAYPPFRREGVPEINDLNVVEEFRRRGVGTALIREAERLAAARGHARIGIGVGAPPDHDAARRLYPRLGYVPDGRGVYRDPPWDDAVYLSKGLTGDEHH